MPNEAATQAIARLAAREATRTEADIQADVYLLLTAGDLKLEAHQVARLEVGTGDGTRRRVDVEVGQCVIEVKRDLEVAGVKTDAEAQLAGYVEAQSKKLGARYVGVLTDGRTWILYRLRGGNLIPVAGALQLNPSSPDGEQLLVWLEAILSTEEAVPPSPVEVQRRLGASSPVHALDIATLGSIFDAAKAVPEVQLKRGLWAKLLRTAFGKAFSGDERLFINHTLLVLTAEIIAHAVLGFDITGPGAPSPTAMAGGTAFTGSQIHGVVEADFFDWVLHAAGGEQFVRDLARRISKFDWSHVEHDVMKLLYESVIPQEARESLGEYYTPDWLAERMVADQVTDPLNQRVLDPSCGSGTFVFHAVRAYLDAADAAGVSNGEAVASLTNHVLGMDIHPVAVTLARVTYLLAIGASRLVQDDRGPIAVPIYLGDALQWEQRLDLLGGADAITISTTGDDLVEGGGGALFGDDLTFPNSVLQDAALFDQLVTAMADKASDTSKRSSSEVVRPVLRQFGIHETDVPALTQTFDTMRRLHASGRDHIWGYYVRNLIRPLWLSQTANRVDVLIGNPPWLRFSKMLKAMQERYKTLCKERGLLTGAQGASGRDLSTLFVARAVGLYLRLNGKFAFVMPHGVLTRKPHDGFRSGRWSSDAGGQLTVGFDDVWDLSKAPTGFPMVSCVVFGRRTRDTAKRMPILVQKWVAKFKSPNVRWKDVADLFTITKTRISALSATDILPESPYRKRFRQGAVLAPRALLFAEEVPAGPLGAGAGRVAVASRRTRDEKKPWKFVQSLKASVEKAFVKAIHLGETVVPFRTTAPLKAVLPIGNKALLTAAAIEEHPGLNEWWSAAEVTWEANKVESDPGTLLDRIDYLHQLSSQVPVAANRVVYTKAGTTIAAARIVDAQAVIDHKLYWCATSNADEARYLVGILNSDTVLQRVRPLQALGLFGGRDIDKSVFSVPIPTYDSADQTHRDVVAVVRDAEQEAASVDLSKSRSFKSSRKAIRKHLAAVGLSARLEAAVAAVIKPVDIPKELVEDLAPEPDPQ